VLLRQAGIDATKLKDEGSRELRFNVNVESGDAASALSVLEKYNLPEKPRKGTDESFGEGGMIPTAEQERAKRIVGVEGDIVNSLRKVPRVISVEAAVSIPEDDPLRDETVERPRPKASVIVVYLRDETGTPPVSAEEVQRHVQAKLPEMKSSEVNVLLLPSGDPSGVSAPDAEAPVVTTGAGCAEGCEATESVLGITVCAGERKKVLNYIIGAVVLSGIMAGLAVVAILRAFRYRRDLTRLTAQFRGVS
jgi:type III secretory pathway lipoprotein EscJ